MGFGEMLLLIEYQFIMCV